METICSFETSGFFQTTWPCNPEDTHSGGGRMSSIVLEGSQASPTGSPDKGVMKGRSQGGEK